MNSIEKIYSVSGLNREAGKLLESSFGTISLEGEVSNITFHSSGHIYFTLKDEFAALDAVMFRSSAERLSFRPERGTKLLVRASLSIYARTGRYQLIVRSMKEKGAGSLEEKFLKLKEKLKKEGLFDQENKKQIPAYPRLVGIITSPTGAAIRDILNVMNRRFAGIRVLIYPARVQGEGAAEELSKGLRALNTHYPDMDLIIVGRGGGSLEDLWPFNEEELARAIAASSIPVISAVGHETDVTISDFVADLRAPTPSAAAELVTREKQEVKSEVIKLYSQILSSVLNTLKIYSSRLERESSTAIFKTPLIILRDKMQDIDRAFNELNSSISKSLLGKRQKFEIACSRLSSLSPKKILSRGYSITFVGDRLLNSALDIKKNDQLRTLLSDGEIWSSVIDKRENDNE